MRFLGYVIFWYDVCIEDKQIKAVLNKLKRQVTQDILMFLRFLNFCWQIIQRVNEITVTLISILRSTNNHAANKLILTKYNLNRICGGKMIVEANGVHNESITRFFTFRTRLTFVKLRWAFILASIMPHFDLESYIRIKINVSRYVSCEILN